MKKIVIFLASCLFMSAGVHSQTCLPDDVAFKVKNEAFVNSKIQEIAQFMTDDLGPRLAASKLKLRSEGMVVEKLTELGLSNARTEFATNFPKGGWDNEKNYVAMTAPYYCSFAANPKAWSGSTAGLVSGECVLFTATTLAELEAYKGKLTDKVVLMPITQIYEMSAEPLMKRYSEEEMAEFAKDPRPSSSARRRMPMSKEYMEFQQGLVAFFRTEKPLAILSGSGTFNVAHSRGVSYKVGDSEPIADIILPIEAHSRMVRMATKGEKVVVELDVKNSFTDNQKINNVVAEIVGSDPKLKNEVVLIGAHLDSWHGSTGAADNASGCIVMMEAMRIIKALNITPRRTIRIALWGGEEQGLHGSRGYANQYLYDTATKKKLDSYDKFALYLNMDNGSGRFRGIYLEETDQALSFLTCWKKPLESLGFDVLSLRKTGSTDHVTFQRLGLPAYQFIQDPLEYRRTYHTTMDTYERLSLNDLQINAAIVAWLVLNAAMDNDRIPVKPGYPELGVMPAQ